MIICYEFEREGIEYLTTEDRSWNHKGQPMATRVAHRLPGTDLWVPDYGSDDINWMDLDEADQSFASREQAVHWIRTGEMPAQRRAA